jgi:endogenous inhibitor of DNA gyrase (YacG/DUF329 family)
MKIICKECNKVLNSFKGLTTHIQFNHNKKDYYDKYMKKEGEGFCKICNKPTEFDSVGKGYHIFCSKECQIIDIGKNNTEMFKLIGEQITQKKEQTNMERYGVKNNTQRKEIMDQIKKTNLILYNVENVINNQEIFNKAKKKREETCFNQNGVKHYFQVDSVKEKIRKTCIKVYGVGSASQNKEVHDKQQKNSCWSRKYKNTNINYRASYELDFLEKYYNVYPNIKNGPRIKYLLENKEHYYFPDFYIPSLNLIIEIKNSYLAKKHKETIEAKRKATISNGFNYIMIVDKNYSEIRNAYPHVFPQSKHSSICPP